MMKKAGIFIIVFLYCLSSINAQAFNVNTHYLDQAAEALSVVEYNGGFYCLDYVDKSKRLLHIDHQDNVISNDSVNPLFFELVVENGNMYAIDVNMDMHLFDGKNFTTPENRKYKETFFEDDKYLVSRSCSGEWGGTLFFTDKKTKKKYECESTCPVAIHKINDSYTITASLAHLSGWVEVFEITNPKKMKPYKEKKKNGYINIADQSRSQSGKKILAKESDMTAGTSFIYNDTLYHLLSEQPPVLAYDEKDCYASIYTIKEGKFKEVTRLLNEDVYFIGQSVKANENTGFIFRTFENRRTGFVYIHGNNVDVYVFGQEKQ